MSNFLFVILIMCFKYFEAKLISVFIMVGKNEYLGELQNNTLIKQINHEKNNNLISVTNEFAGIIKEKYFKNESINYTTNLFSDNDDNISSKIKIYTKNDKSYFNLGVSFIKGLFPDCVYESEKIISNLNINNFTIINNTEEIEKEFLKQGAANISPINNFTVFNEAESLNQIEKHFLKKKLTSKYDKCNQTDIKIEYFSDQMDILFKPENCIYLNHLNDVNLNNS